MIQAPLQLQDYWVDFIQVRTNPDFDPKAAADLDLETLDVQSDVAPIPIENVEKIGTAWMVTLAIRQTIPDKRNIPYEFSLDIAGVVAVHPSYTGEKLANVIQVNGPSMLFGAAREILRAATGRGPYPPVIIPSTNFFQRLPQKPEPAAEEKPPVKKAAAKKKSAAKTPRKRTK